MSTEEKRLIERLLRSVILLMQQAKVSPPLIERAKALYEDMEEL